MPLKISDSLKRKIVDDYVRQNIEQLLIDKSNGICFLCNGKIELSTQDIQADHDIPETFDGPTDLENLNAVHKTCNLIKNKYPTDLIKTFLPFKNFLATNEGADFSIVSPKYFEFPQHSSYLKYNPSDGLSIRNLDWHLQNLNIFRERDIHKHVTYYTFARIPIRLLKNDDVQPRSIKADHVLKLLQDLRDNPLHEPVGVRLSEPINFDDETSFDKPIELLMFDGQHKAVASTLHQSILTGEFSKSEIDVKIYLNFSKNSAVRLVNSIQSKIIKLGLTKLEFARRMSDEWKDAFENYNSLCNEKGKSPTEIGFINGTAPEKRARAKEALLNARINEIIHSTGNEKIPICSVGIKEATLINRVIKAMMFHKPFPENMAIETRTIERKNIQLVLSDIAELLFNGEHPDSIRKLLMSQSSLKLIVSWTIRFLENKMSVEQHVFMRADFSKKYETTELREQFQRFLSNYVNHPIWSATQEDKQKIKVDKFYSTLRQNKDIREAGEDVKLTLHYCTYGDTPVNPFD